MPTYRLEIHHEGKSLAFGGDHACGEFLQIWDTTENSEPESENVLVDEDSFTGFTRDKMIALIAEHGFTLTELKEAHQKWERDTTFFDTTFLPADFV